MTSAAAAQWERFGPVTGQAIRSLEQTADRCAKGAPSVEQLELMSPEVPMPAFLQRLDRPEPRLEVASGLLGDPSRRLPQQVHTVYETRAGVRSSRLRRRALGLLAVLPVVDRRELDDVVADFPGLSSDVPYPAVVPAP